jgi:hypothetical protein
MSRLLLTVRMTLDYHGRFPRRKLLPLYWRIAGTLNH